ncbi:histidine phosphatase family protein [Cellulomonas sp. zg-ZUI22]|nr:histidine phosphatase family protein [Cellulomonas sp. zg-ZUI22]
MDRRPSTAKTAGVTSTPPRDDRPADDRHAADAHAPDPSSADPSPADALAASAADPAGSGASAAPGTRRRADRPSGSVPRFDDDEPTTVVLVRHGQTTMTVSRGYSGSSEPGPSLDERGRLQAAAAAALVHRVGRDLWGDIDYPSEIVASPMVRTQETAAVMAERLGLSVRTDAAFREAHFGHWQGLTSEQIEERWPGRLEPWHTTGRLRPPGGGESIEDVGVRLRAGLDALRAGGSRTVVVVSHAVAIRAALGVTLGADPGTWSQLRVAPASVSIIRLFGDRRDEIAVAGAPSEGW